MPLVSHRSLKLAETKSRDLYVMLASYRCCFQGFVENRFLPCVLESYSELALACLSQA